MGYSRRVRFGDNRSGLGRVEFASEFTTRLAPARPVPSGAADSGPAAAQQVQEQPPRLGRHARRGL